LFRVLAKVERLHEVMAFLVTEKVTLGLMLLEARRDRGLD
jgi:hypothetical protein